MEEKPIEIEEGIYINAKHNSIMLINGYKKRWTDIFILFANQVRITFLGSGVNKMDKPKIMILGTFHMASYKNLYNFNLDDLMSEKRQSEIIDLVDKIKNLKPTKIAVEREYKYEEELNAKYIRYVNGETDLEMHESQQIAFRLAKSLGHKKIYAVDWMEKGAGSCSIGEVYEYTKKEQPQFLKLFDDLSFNLKGNCTISDIYRFFNEKAYIDKLHKAYINMARIGIYDRYKGMGWLTWWYQRNLIIFAHLSQLIDKPNDRIFLLIGAGHVGILSNFLNESGLFEVVDPLDYL